MSQPLPHGYKFYLIASKINNFAWYFSNGVTILAALFGGFFIACTNRCKRRYLSLATLDTSLLLLGMAVVAPKSKSNTWLLIDVGV